MTSLFLILIVIQIIINLILVIDFIFFTYQFQNGTHMESIKNLILPPEDNFQYSRQLLNFILLSIPPIYLILFIMNMVIMIITKSLKYSDKKMNKKRKESIIKKNQNNRGF